jgi:hypothetical protein
MKTRITLAAVMVLSLVVAGFVLARSASQGPAAVSSVSPFTLKRNITRRSLDGERTETRREIYRRASDGSFRLIETDGKTIFRDWGFQQGRGVFYVNYKDRMLVRDASQLAARPTLSYTVEAWTRQQEFVRTEPILGVTAYLMRFDGVEEWVAAETGGMPLRTIHYAGDKVTMEADAYSLEVGEPPAELVRLPDFPVKDLPAEK